MILTSPTATDVRVFKEAKYLTEKGHEVEILWWDKLPERDLPEIEKIDGFRIRRFKIRSKPGSGYRQLVPYLKFRNQCKKYLAKTRYDILHCHDMDGALIGKTVSGKYVFDMHEFYDKGNFIKKTVSHFLARNLARHAIANIYVSERNTEAYGKGIENKFLPLKNYSDKKQFCDISKTDSRKLRISYIGTVRNQVPEFTALFEAVKDMEDVEVNIYGTGIDIPFLENISCEYPNVTLKGEFNGVRDAAKIYRDTDISFIAYDPNNPNYQGEFEPVKLYEAIVTKTPFIATKNLYPGLIAERFGIGISCDTKDKDDIRRAVCELKTYSKFYAQYEKNIQQIANKYNWTSAVMVLDRIYTADATDAAERG